MECLIADGERKAQHSHHIAAVALGEDAVQRWGDGEVAQQWVIECKFYVALVAIEGKCTVGGNARRHAVGKFRYYAHGGISAARLFSRRGVPAALQQQAEPGPAAADGAQFSPPAAGHQQQVYCRFPLDRFRLRRFQAKARARRPRATSAQTRR